MSQKVFVVSLHKSMTRSTDILLSMLGYSTIHFPKFYRGKNFLEAVRGIEDRPRQVVDRLQPIWDNFDAVGDVPVPGLYQTLARRWPGSRFVLVTRDPYSWANSVKRHLRRRVLSPFNRVQYIPYLGRDVRKLDGISEGALARVCSRHVREVTGFFEEELREPHRLCVVDGTCDGVGEKVCRFLGAPERALPRLAGRPSEQELATSREWVAARPDEADAHYLLAKNLRYFGEYEEALQAVKRALSLAPYHAKAYALQSDMLYERGWRVDSAKLARLAVENGLEQPRYCYRGARDWVYRGRAGSAVALWTRGARRRLTKRWAR